MKTISGFLASENNYHILTINELQYVKGGDDPGSNGDDPFKKKLKKPHSFLNGNSWGDK